MYTASINFVAQCTTDEGRIEKVSSTASVEFNRAVQNSRDLTTTYENLSLNAGPPVLSILINRGDNDMVVRLEEPNQTVWAEFNVMSGGIFTVPARFIADGSEFMVETIYAKSATGAGRVEYFMFLSY